MAFTSEDREALVAGRFAEMKAALQLNSAQEKHWSAVEATLHNVAKARAARRSEIRQRYASAAGGRTPDVSGRLHEYAKGLRSRADQVEQLASAAKPLLGSLDENQHRRFAALLARNHRRKARAKQFNRGSRHVKRIIRRASSKS